MPKGLKKVNDKNNVREKKRKKIRVEDAARILEKFHIFSWLKSFLGYVDMRIIMYSILKRCNIYLLNIF